MDDLDLGATIRGFSPGQKVFHRYTLKKILGRGGMGVVWLAHDDKLDRDVALKFLPEVVAADPRAIDDLKRETRRSLELTHPHIVRIYDFIDDARTAAIAMEYVAGDTLSKLALDQPDRVFTVGQLEPWVRQLCDALDYAHAKASVVHRDLKPANLMIDARGDLKVADFGIAASVSDSVSRVSAQAGSSGTPVYMSPQQMMGGKPAVTDDIYALGATLYDLLTGKPPFHSGNIILQVQHKVPPSVAERRAELNVRNTNIPPAWEETIAACLAKEPQDRPQSAAEVARRVGMAETGWRNEAEGRAKPPAEPSISGEAAVRQPARRGRLALPLAVGVVLLAAAGYYFGIHAPEQRRLAEIARLEAEGRAAEAARLRNEQERAEAAARAQAEQEQGAYAVIKARIDALLDESPPAQRAATATAVQAYLAGAPTRYRAEVEAAWTKRAAGWEAAQLAAEAARLAAARGGIAVRTTPAGAEVRVGAIAVEKSPLTLKDQKLGTYPVVIKLDGYEDWSGEVEVKENEFADLDVNLIPKGAKYIVRSGDTAARIAREKGLTVTDLQKLNPDVNWSRLYIGQILNVGAPAMATLGSVLPVDTNALSVQSVAEAGKAWTIPDFGLKLMPIAAGTFAMGSASGGNSDERPVTRVTLTKPYWLGATEVTQAQWSAVMGSNPSRFKGDSLPVENVSWDESLAFCRKLTERERAAGRLPEGYVYTLPTEAQWEYACRAGTTGDYAGNLNAMGWYDNNSGGTTHPVGQKQANGWGLHDMHGNVWEWCLDWYGSYPGGSVTDPRGAASGSPRGGSWYVDAFYCRSASRSGHESSDYRRSYLGFRLALTPAP